MKIRVCVWEGGGAGVVAIFGPLFMIWVLITHTLQSAYMTVYVLGGVVVGRGIEFPFHVLYLTCFCGSWTAPLPNIWSLYV